MSPGNEHDVTRAEELTKDLKNTKILGDKGYDSQQFVDFF
ncbi:MAG: transposase, partial [Holosporaceae bacterium]|nr:transposase [Holosporaceae bacterium]